MYVRCSRALTMRIAEPWWDIRAGVYSGVWRGAWAAMAAVALVGSSGCRSAVPALTAPQLESAVVHLNRPLPGEPAALYRLRVRSSGGLRLAVRTSGLQGRLTVSEPFGSAVSITSWEGSEPPTFFDLREGCRLEASDLSQVLGIGILPLPQAVRLLGGRLPTAEGDRISLREDGLLLIEGPGWAAVVTVMPEPWRVVSVEEMGSGRSGWSLKLSDHTSSVPGFVRVEQRGGRWAELDLISLEWKEGDTLPDLPELPDCTLRPPR